MITAHQAWVVSATGWSGCLWDVYYIGTSTYPTIVCIYSYYTRKILHSTKQIYIKDFLKLFDYENYHTAGNFGGSNAWQKWMDKDFGEKSLTNE